MTTTITAPRHTAEQIHAMRLPEVWALYTSATGHETKCPNKKWLATKILDAEAAQPEPAPAEQPAAPQPTPEPAPASEPPAPAAQPVQVAPAVNPATGLPHDSFYDFYDDEPAQPEQPAPASEEQASDEKEDAPRTKGAFAGLTMDNLRTRYQDAFGKATKSTNRSYLEWRLRLHERGLSRSQVQGKGRSHGEPVEMQILPLRVRKAAVAPLDEVVEVLRYASRNAMILEAIEKLLDAVSAAHPAHEDAQRALQALQGDAE